MNDMNEALQNLKFAKDFWVVLMPSILMAIDVVTGFVNAWARSNIKSSVMRQGLARKFGELVVIGIAQLFFYGVGMPKYAVMGISTYIILMELISICENLDKLGVPIPKFIKKALTKAEEKIDDLSGDDEEDEKTDAEPKKKGGRKNAKSKND